MKPLFKQAHNIVLHQKACGPLRESFSRRHFLRISATLVFAAGVGFLKARVAWSHWPANPLRSTFAKLGLKRSIVLCNSRDAAHRSYAGEIEFGMNCAYLSKFLEHSEQKVEVPLFSVHLWQSQFPYSRVGWTACARSSLVINAVTN